MPEPDQSGQLLRALSDGFAEMFDTRIGTEDLRGLETLQRQERLTERELNLDLSLVSLIVLGQRVECFEGRNQVLRRLQVRESRDGQLGGALIVRNGLFVRARRSTVPRHDLGFGLYLLWKALLEDRHDPSV